jgi:hypothetical protein
MKSTRLSQKQKLEVIGNNADNNSTHNGEWLVRISGRVTGLPGSNQVIYTDDERANNSGIPDQPENLL